RDLRVPALGVAAWLGALAGLRPGLLAHLSWGWCLLVLVPVAVWTLVARRWTVAAWLAVGVAVAAGAGFRHTAVGAGAIADLAEARAAVAVELRVVDDPRQIAGGFGDADRVRVRVRVDRLTRDGQEWRVRSPVLLFADGPWAETE